MQLALCNNCLRVREFESYEAACTSDCVCGATAEGADSYCPCEGCASAAAALVAGERNAALLGITCDLSCWSAELGVMREAA